MNSAAAAEYLNTLNLDPRDGSLRPINVFGHRMNHFVGYTFQDMLGDGDSTAKLKEVIQIAAPGAVGKVLKFSK